MLCGIHYFIAKLKKKIDVIILSRFSVKIIALGKTHHSISAYFIVHNEDHDEMILFRTYSAPRVLHCIDWTVHFSAGQKAVS